MIGSTLFAVPKKQKDVENPDMLDDNTIYGIKGWLVAKLNGELNGGSEKEYYDRMERRAFQCVDFKDRCDNIAAFEKSAAFPLEADVSEDFRSLLNRYLPDHCLGAKEWRETIVDYVSKFRSGETDVATIKDELWNLTAAEKNGAVAFYGANGMVVVCLVLYELERLAGIVQ